MENANPKINPVTTYLGLAMAIIAVIMLCTLVIAEVFLKVSTDLPKYVWYTPGGILILGLILILSPDSIARVFNKGADKVIDGKEQK